MSMDRLLLIICTLTILIACETKGDGTPPTNPTKRVSQENQTGEPTKPRHLSYKPKQIKHESAVTALALSSDGTVFATGCKNGTIQLWRLPSGMKIREIDGHELVIADLAFSPSGRTLASQGTNDSTIRIWDVMTGNEISSHKGYAPLAFSPDGAILASSGVTLRDVATGKVVYQLGIKSESAHSIAFSPDGKTVAAGFQNGPMRLWELSTGKEIRNWRAKQGPSDSCSVSFSPDGGFLLGVERWFGSGLMNGGHGQVWIWDSLSGQELLNFTCDQIEIRSFSLSPNGHTLATCGDNGSIRLWELATGSKLIRIRQSGPSSGWFPRTLALSPNGKTLLSEGPSGSTLVLDLEAMSRHESLKSITLEKLWSRLSSRNAQMAYRSTWALTVRREKTVAFLRDRFVEGRPHAEQVRALIAKLDDDQVGVRDSASKELRQLGSAAEASLIEALNKARSPEARTRISALLKPLRSPITRSPEALRRLRAIQVLERIGTDRAKDVLKSLGTYHALQALKRLEGRHKR